MSKHRKRTALLTGPHFFPATNTDTSPPMAFAAVIAFRVIGVNVSLLCSAITKVLWNRWNCEKTRDSDFGAFDNIFKEFKEAQENFLVKSSKCSTKGSKCNSAYHHNTKNNRTFYNNHIDSDT